MNYTPKIYLAGGFRSDWQSKLMEKFNGKFIFFNPKDHGLENHDQYSIWDFHFVKDCDVLFGFMEESNPSGFGLALEVGIAYSLNKTIIIVDEKSISDQKFRKYFSIVQKASGIVFDNFDEALNYLNKFSF